MRTKSNTLNTVSVKALCKPGKWGVDHRDLSREDSLVFVFLLYPKFEDPKTDPDVWIMPAADVQKRNRGWFQKSAIYYSHAQQKPPDLADFRDAWHYIG